MKKQTTIKVWLIGLLSLLTLNMELSAQDYYPTGAVSTYSGRSQDLSKLPKMDRDIIILQNVLNDLFNGDRGSFYSSGGAKGIYVPGKGVIFNVGQSRHSDSFALVEDILVSQTTGSNTPKEEKSTNEVNEETESRIEKLSEEFLVNYGSILSELKSGEKVMLNVNYSILKESKDDKKRNGTISGGQAQVIYRGNYRRSIKKRMVSSIDYSTINSYLNGKSSLKDAAQKIDKNIVDKSDNSAQDAKIMAGILDDLFQSNFEGNFRRSRKTSWTYFEGFGLMYDLNLTGNRRSNIIAYSVGGGTTDGISISDNDEEDKKGGEAKKAELEANYKQLIDMVKESLITYGRTLRSVNSDEVVILNINFGSSFRKTDIPRAVRLQVTKGQIEAFSKGQKSLDQLKNEIDIKKLSASTSHGSDFFEVPSVGDYESIIYETAPEPSTPLRRVTSGKAKKSN